MKRRRRSPLHFEYEKKQDKELSQSVIEYRSVIHVEIDAKAK